MRYLSSCLLACLLISACGANSNRGEPAAKKPGEPAPQEAAPAAFENKIAQVIGELDGVGLQPVEAVFAVGRYYDALPGMLILIGDTAGLCEDMQNDRLPADSTILGMGLLQMPGGTEQTHYELGEDVEPTAIVELRKLDSNCSVQSDVGKLVRPDEVTVDLTTVASDYVEGSFAFKTEQAGAMQGSFHARFCDAAQFIKMGGPSDGRTHCRNPVQ